jgi:hypothetical protein
MPIGRPLTARATIHDHQPDSSSFPASMRNTGTPDARLPEMRCEHYHLRGADATEARTGGIEMS